MQYQNDSERERFTITWRGIRSAGTGGGGEGAKGGKKKRVGCGGGGGFKGGDQGISRVKKEGPLLQGRGGEHPNRKKGLQKVKGGPLTEGGGRGGGECGLWDKGKKTHLVGGMLQQKGELGP